MASEHEGLKTPEAPPPQTRRKADTWDRIKLLVLFGIVLVAVVGTRVNSPFVTIGEVFGEFVRQPAGILLVTLILWEVWRQIHYLLSERNARYHEFWQKRFFGGLERGASRLKPWTRFRVRRFFKWILYVILYAFLADYLITAVSSPTQAIVESPRIILGLLFNENTLRVLIIMVISIGQFVAIFWFLSRGGMDTILPEEIKTRFRDVWGQDHVLDLIKENIAFLEKPDAIEAKGGYIPSGILLWGPPGTGKTLIAESVAGETGRPFVFIEPGAFINMFFGIGVLKVKGLYRKLRKLSLRHGGVIAFFDEADALGSRGGMGAPQGQFGHGAQALTGCGNFSYLSPMTQKMLLDTLEQPQTDEAPKRRLLDKVMMGGMGGGGGMGTLQALLTEMNGLTKPRGMANRMRKAFGFRPKPPPRYRILHIMATNMPNALDEAMLRPGRIDRIYKVGFPSREGRRTTLAGYLAKVKHTLTEAQVDRLAVATPYYSGARIKDLVNEALILAIRDNREVIEWNDIWKAKALKELGPPDDADYIERERHAVAVHEASHAVAAHVLRVHSGIDLVTIQRRGNIGGMVKNLPVEDRFTQWKSEFETDVMVSLASLAGERMFFGDDNSSGVTADLSAATKVSALMEGAWGMGASMMSYVDTTETGYGGAGSPISASLRAHREEIDARLKTLYDRVWTLLDEHRDKVLAISAVLEEKKTISGDEVAEIMGTPPGERQMREPTGWRTIDEAAGAARGRAALGKLAGSPNGQKEEDGPKEEESEPEPVEAGGAD